MCSGALYEAFSAAMAYFMHTLIASGTLLEPLQVAAVIIYDIDGFFSVCLTRARQTVAFLI
jgi:hypothetical protein